MLEWSVAAAAFSIVVFMAYAIYTLCEVRSSIRRLDGTIGLIRARFDEVAAQSVELLQTSNRLAQDAEAKMLALNGAFAAAKQLGDSVHGVSQSIGELSAVFLGPRKPSVR